MNAKDLMLDQIERDPGCLVDYADENEIRDLYRNLYAIIREPYGSDQHYTAQSFLERHILLAVREYYVKNQEQAEQEVIEYYANVGAA